MQRSQFFYKCFKLSAIVLLGCLVMLAVSSCNGGKKGTGESTPFKMNCVTITKAQLKVWADSGWFNADNPNRIKYILVQFYSSNPSKSNSNMQLVAFPCKSLGEININAKIILGIDNSCDGMTFSGPVMFASSYICTEGLGITTKEGTFNTDIGNITLVPNADNPSCVGFSMETESRGVVDTTRIPWPCPPYCCPGPCCPIKDTLIN